MTPVPPSEQDIGQLRTALTQFAGATGPFDADGKFIQSEGRSTLWLSLPLSAADLEKLWVHQGLKRDGQQAVSFAALKSASDLRLKVMAHKFRRGFFSYHWIGNLEFRSEAKGAVSYCGTVAGKTDREMWDQLRQFLALRMTIYRSPSVALSRPN